MNIRVNERGTRQGDISAIATDHMSGFGNGFETKALGGALPRGRNSPQRCPYGLMRSS